MAASRQNYRPLESLSPPVRAHLTHSLPHLVEYWCREYRLSTGRGEISEIRVLSEGDKDQGFNYLFDHDFERVIAAYGFAGQRNAIARKEADKRLKGHPRQKHSRYDRGHLMSHLLGGGADINIFPQDRTVNRGAFQTMEQLVLEHPGSFYFVHLIYDRRDRLDTISAGTPVEVEQGAVLELGGRTSFKYELYRN